MGEFALTIGNYGADRVNGSRRRDHLRLAHRGRNPQLLTSESEFRSRVLALVNRENDKRRARGEETIFSYDAYMDIAPRLFLRNLLQSGQIDQSEFDKRMEIEDEITKINLRTNLAERHKAPLHQINLVIQNGKLFRRGNASEPLESMYVRGLEFLETNRYPIDRDRERAEVSSFQTIIQSFLTNPDSVAGSRILYASPPGDKAPVGEHETRYPHNFIDVYEVVQNNQGAKEVVMTRYPIDLSKPQIAEKLQALAPEFVIPTVDVIPSAYFLAHPIVLVPNHKINNIHAHFQGPKGCISKEQFDQILAATEEERAYYIRQLRERIFDKDHIYLCFDAILNVSDEVLKPKPNRIYRFNPSISSDIPVTDIKRLPIDMRVAIMGSRPVEVRAAGCGNSAGMSMGLGITRFSLLSPFNVAEVGEAVLTINDKEDQYGKREFDCPACGYTNERPLNGFVALCQNEKCPDPRAVACSKAA